MFLGCAIPQSGSFFGWEGAICCWGGGQQGRRKFYDRDLVRGDTNQGVQLNLVGERK